MRGNQRIMLTKRLLQEALIRIMKRKPLEKINITELCEEAGINRSTFYRHYNLPCEVLSEMQTQFVKRIQSSIDMNPLMDSPLKYMEKVCEYIYENAELVIIFIQNNSEEEIASLFDDFFDTLLRQNSVLMQKYKLDDSEIRLVSSYMSGGGYFMLRRWLLDSIDKTPAEISRLVLSFFNNRWNNGDVSLWHN